MNISPVHAMCCSGCEFVTVSATIIHWEDAALRAGDWGNGTFQVCACNAPGESR